jgi:hypothetical protein
MNLKKLFRKTACYGFVTRNQIFVIFKMYFVTKIYEFKICLCQFSEKILYHIVYSCIIICFQFCTSADSLNNPWLAGTCYNSINYVLQTAFSNNIFSLYTIDTVFNR